MKKKFKFIKQTLYKITYCEKFRNSFEPIRVLTSFVRNTPWHYEFGHPYNLDKNKTTSGLVGIRDGEFYSIEPVTDEELKTWVENTVSFQHWIEEKDNGIDPCHEDVLTIKSYFGETIKFDINNGNK